MNYNTTNEIKYKYDTSDIDWKPFITEGCFYKLFHVDVKSGLAEMIVKFEPNSQCMYHRHVATTTTMVLEGELIVRELVDGKEEINIKPAGSYSIGGEGEVHIEGSGDKQAIIFFSMKTNSDIIYELLNPDLTLRKAITTAEFEKDWKDKWPQEEAA